MTSESAFIEAFLSLEPRLLLFELGLLLRQRRLLELGQPMMWSFSHVAAGIAFFNVLSQERRLKRVLVFLSVRISLTILAGTLWLLAFKPVKDLCIYARASQYWMLLEKIFDNLKAPQQPKEHHGLHTRILKYLNLDLPSRNPKKIIKHNP